MTDYGTFDTGFHQENDTTGCIGIGRAHSNAIFLLRPSSRREHDLHGENMLMLQAITSSSRKPVQRSCFQHIENQGVRSYKERTR